MKPPPSMVMLITIRGRGIRKPSVYEVNDDEVLGASYVTVH